MKPVFLGMSNPHSSDPGRAFWPDPPGSFGHDIWALMNEYGPISKLDFLNAFERINLMPSIWRPELAEEKLKEIWPKFRDRLVVCWNLPVAIAAGLSGWTPLKWQVVDGVLACYAYIPARESTAYNHEIIRHAVAMRLWTLYNAERIGIKSEAA